MKKYLKHLRSNWLIPFLISFVCLLNLFVITATASNSITLYTPYTKISVPPGESISYAIDIINNSNELKNAEMALSGIPRGWDYNFKSGAYNIGQLSVLPGEKKSFTLNLVVPLKVNKGSYKFYVTAKGFDPLPLTVIVSKQGTFKTEFTADQPNMEGPSSSNFTFSADLKNHTADDQLYSLIANAPRGWKVALKAEYKQVTSVNVEANSTKKITIEIDPPDEIKAGKYKIPIAVQTNSTSAKLDLEVVITGSYNVQLTTPGALVSTDIIAGDERRLEFLLINTGSAGLRDINLSYNAPANWEITYDPKKVENLGPGERVQVFAVVKAAKNAIAGDYMAKFEAKAPETSSKIDFRISVKTPMIYGWIGIMIIVFALGSVFYMFRKFGRR